MLCALIMAGGKGERFWPLSTDEKPKQFLNLLGKETMIQMTVNRIKELITMDRIFVVTVEKYVELLKEQLPELPDRNIIVEPVGKNTAPCIALSAFIIQKYYKDATIAVLPADHFIKDEEEFRRVLDSSYKFIDNEPEAIVTLGMKPNRPETGYGYIKLIDNNKEINKSINKIYKVERFVEKPDLYKAKKYLEDGNFLWNTGIFLWTTKNILKLTRKYIENTYNILKEIAITSEEEYEYALKKSYKTIDSISVDYAIMEKSQQMYVIPSNFGWDDVGTWNAMERYGEKDEDNNVFVGNIVNMDSKNNIVVGKNKPIVIAGLENIFVVECDDLIMVISKENIEKIKEIKKRFSK
jgi:mannose-1-phosphate guanylyltransferase